MQTPTGISGAEEILAEFEGDLRAPTPEFVIPTVEPSKAEDAGFNLEEMLQGFDDSLQESAEPPPVLVPDPAVIEVVKPSGAHTPKEEEILYELFFRDREPLILRIEDLSAMLVWGAQNGVSDTFIYSGFPITVNRYGRLIRLMRRPLEVNEVMSLMAAIRPNSESTLLSGSAVDTRFDFAPDRNRRYGFRVNATRGMEKTGADKAVEIVMRTIPYDIPDMEKLKVPQPIIDNFYPKDGLILVAGVTGSGKSTLMAAMIKNGLTKHEPRLLTYEAPPEFPLVAIPGMKGMVFQCEVGVHVKSFAEGVRNSLRRAPDWIMIGEARDQETIEMTVRAVETGHTVYSTVHTRSVTNTIDRMADEFPPATRWGVKVKLIDAMRLVIYQRLVKVPSGGRTALREYLVFTPEIREALIRGGESRYPEILKEAMHSHGCYLWQDAEEKFKQGQMYESDYLEIREAGGAL